MGVRYKIESNGKNILTERTYYKKGSDFFIVEESKKEFKIITKQSPDYKWEQKTKLYSLNEYENTLYTPSIEKLIFSSGVDKDEQKVIRKLFKTWDQDKLLKMGWKFFDESTKIFGESIVVQTPYNRLDFYGYLTEITCMNISKEQFKKYSQEGISDSDEGLDDFYSYTLTQFSDPSCELEINGIEYPIEKRLEKLIKSNSKKIVNHYSDLMIVRESFSKGGNYFLEIFEEFDPKKFNIEVENYVIGKNKKSINLLFSPTYDGEGFEYEDGGNTKGDDWSLVDEKGIVHSVEFDGSDEDEDEFDEEDE